MTDTLDVEHIPLIEIRGVRYVPLEVYVARVNALTVGRELVEDEDGTYVSAVPYLKALDRIKTHEATIATLYAIIAEHEADSGLLDAIETEWRENGPILLSQTEDGALGVWIGDIASSVAKGTSDSDARTALHEAFYPE